MQLSAKNTLTGSYIGNGAYSDLASPFIANGNSQTFVVNTDTSSMRTSIAAALGYQNQGAFDVSFLGNYIQTFATNCT